MAQKNINPGNPPIIWSTIDDAFKNINSNFTELYLSLGGPGVNLTELASSVVPDTDSVRDLGSATKRWRNLYLNGNSLWLGVAHITANADGQVNLPPGSTIAGQAIGTPESRAFRTVKVLGQADLLSTDNEVLTMAGTGITITSDSNTNTLTFAATALDQIIAGTGIGVNRANGQVVVNNTGVVDITTGPGLQVTSNNNTYTITSLTPTNVFNNIAVLGQETITAPEGSNTLTLVGQGNIVLSTNNTTKSISISVDNTIDITGSVFSEDSIMLIDSLNARIIAEHVKGTFKSITTESGVTILGDTSELQSDLDSVNSTLTIVDQQIVNLTATVDLLNSQLAANPTPEESININNQLTVAQTTLTGLNSQKTSLESQQSYFQSLIANDRSSIIYNVGLGMLDVNTAITARIFKGVFSGDLSGSVFADGSTMLIDGTEGKIIGDIRTSSLRTTEDTLALGSDAGQNLQGALAIALGWMAGNQSQGGSSVAIGSAAGYISQGENSIAIGSDSGSTMQGTNSISIGKISGNSNQSHHSIAIGAGAGAVDQAANSIILNAQSTGSGSSDYTVLSSTTPGFFVAPIREVTGVKSLFYNPTTNEITYHDAPSGGGGFFNFYLQGDDSTPVEINSGDAVQIAGVDGISTSTDNSGNIRISGAGISALQSRITVVGNSGPLNNAETADIVIPGFKGYILYKIQTTAASWVRVYTSPIAQVADAARTESQDPTSGSGIIAEVITTGAESVPMTPGLIGFNDEIVPNTNIFVSVTNKSGAVADVAVSLTILKIEE